MTVQWKRGTDLRMVLAVESGEVTGTEIVRSVLKQVSGDGFEEVLEFVSEFAEADENNPDRWYLIGSAADSLVLKPVNYDCDVRVEDAIGNVTQTTTFALKVVERVTEAAT